MRRFAKISTIGVFVLILVSYFAACGKIPLGDTGQPLEFSVVFNSQGGSSVPAITNVQNGAYIAAPDAPEKAGYIYEGWYKEPETVNAWDFRTDRVKANTTLYAKWAPVVYTISYHSNGGTGATESTAHHYDSESALAANGFTRDGFVFSGWNTEADGSGAGYAGGVSVILKNIIAENYTDIMLFAQWAPVLNTIAFNANGGNGSMAAQSLGVSQTASLKANSFKKTGYAFKGWALTGGGAAVYADGASFTMASEDTVVLFAVWEARVYTITYRDEGNAVFSGAHGTDYPVSHTYGASTRLVNPAKTGYTFGGWFIDGACTGTALTGLRPTDYTDGITLYAKWTAKSNNLVFDGNGAAGGSTASMSNIQGGTSIHLPVSGYTRPNYDFAGWNTQANGRGTTYQPDDLYAVPVREDAVTLYAKWTAHTYTITYSDEGGAAFSGTHGAGYPAAHTYGADTNLVNPVKAGHTFGGWFADSGCAGTAVVSLAGTAYTTGITLYAKWYAGEATPNLAFTPIKSGTEYSVSKGTATAAVVIIPQIYNNLPVTEVAANGFQNYTGMKSITIPNSVTSIGKGALGGCSGLVSVTLPFAGANKAVADSNDADPVNDALFGYIFGTASYAGGVLTSQVSKENYYIPASLRTVVINNNNATAIGSYAFALCKGLTSITLPDGLLRIGKNAFGNCEGLTALNIPESVRTIDDFAFSYCGSLTSIALPDGLTAIGTGLFRNCTELADVTLPDSVETIGSSAFDNCPSLVNVKLPDSLTNIGNTAFRGCSALTSIIIPDRITAIGASAFMYCSKLTVYAEKAAAGSGWNASWNYSNRPVLWGCTLPAAKDCVLSFTTGAAALSNPYAAGGISAPHRDGYVFEGWAAVSGGTAAYPADKIHTAPNGISLWAVWSLC